MDLRTTFEIKESGDKITYDHPVLFIGSCFAGGIGRQMMDGKMPVMVNPSGTVYNPVSVANTIDTITDGRKYAKDDLYNYNGIWLSFNHYTDFSSDNPEVTVDRINMAADRARKFLSAARFLFVTFGTARVYRWNKTGRIVSNCHKLPAPEFTNELLTVNSVVSLWEAELQKLGNLFPDLKVVFTISPVRHWKDGAHGNQISISVLMLAVEELLKHPSGPSYFPAYELIMDDLRDYRFYEEDMLHPSSLAIKYVWEKFSGCYLDSRSAELRNEIIKITRASGHRLTSQVESKRKEFAVAMLQRIRAIENKMATIDLSEEKLYFKKWAEGI